MADETDAVDESLLPGAKGWANYLQAKLGLRNHWYPVRFSKELGEGEVVEVTLLGESILLRRVDGKLYAIRNRCIHRGVPFTTKLECYSKDTITCWYHGYTYRFTDGKVVDIIGVPGSKVIGKYSIRTFPVTEAQGIAFVFVGDPEAVPPPLAEDVAPGFLESGAVVRGIHRVVASNWRIGVENGYDAAHIYMHRNAELVRANGLMLPLSFQPKDYRSEYFVEVLEADGPKGLFSRKETHEIPIFEGKVQGEVVVTGHEHGTLKIPRHSSIWLPGCLKVDPWPNPDIVQFEWYVPVDETNHLYFQTLLFKPKDDEDLNRFERDYHAKWRPLALNGFNDEDVTAREALQTYYKDDHAWLNEKLCEQDMKILRWRRFASKHARGIQRREHLR